MTKKIMIFLSVMGGVAIGAGLVSTCNPEYKYKPIITPDSININPTPGDLAKQAFIEDSLKLAARDDLKKGMADIINGYYKNFKNSQHSGYFITDLDDDELPELWVLIGTPGENFRLELFYPMLNGTLKRSFSFSGFGSFYRGNDYLMQVAKSGTDFVDVNKITIRKGEIYVETQHSIDLATSSDVKLPKFKEHPLSTISFSNLDPIIRAFE